jgi:hypothetical protein
MSADNSIYIRPLKNGKFAVNCISSLYPDGLTDEEIDLAFSHLEDSQLCESLEAAKIEVDRIYEEYDRHGWPIEYGDEILERKS